MEEEIESLETLSSDNLEATREFDLVLPDWTLVEVSLSASVVLWRKLAGTARTVFESGTRMDVALLAKYPVFRKFGELMSEFAAGEESMANASTSEMEREVGLV